MIASAPFCVIVKRCVAIDDRQAHNLSISPACSNCEPNAVLLNAGDSMAIESVDAFSALSGAEPSPIACLRTTNCLERINRGDQAADTCRISLPQHGVLPAPRLSTPCRVRRGVDDGKGLQSTSTEAVLVLGQTAIADMSKAEDPLDDQEGMLANSSSPRLKGPTF